MKRALDSNASRTAAERETTVSVTDADTHVHIWTARRKDITRLRKHSGATEMRSGFDGTTEWAEFTIPADRWNPATGIRRQGRKLTPEQRAAAAARLAKARANQ